MDVTLAETPDPINYLQFFRMPTVVTITARTSSITNSFAHAIIPVVVPTSDEVKAALTILEMSDQIACAYCGGGYTGLEHLRPLVIDKRPTGYISEIHNLVPSCNKCNGSKGNRLASVDVWPDTTVADDEGRS